MSDLLQDIVTGELILEDGDLVLCTGVDRARQFLAQRLAAVRGEWFANLDEGVPYFESVLVKAPDPVVLEAIFKERILSTPGIIGLDSFDMTLDTATREMSLEFLAQSTDGPINFSQVLGRV